MLRWWWTAGPVRLVVECWALWPPLRQHHGAGVAPDLTMHGGGGWGWGGGGWGSRSGRARCGIRTGRVRVKERASIKDSIDRRWRPLPKLRHPPCSHPRPHYTSPRPHTITPALREREREMFVAPRERERGGEGKGAVCCPQWP